MKPSNSPPGGLDAGTAVTLDSETPIPVPDSSETTNPYERKQHQRALVRFGVLGFAALLIIGGIIVLLVHKSPTSDSLQLGDFPTTHVTLPTVSSPSQSAAQKLQVNGQLEANDSLVLSPTTQPAIPIIGQIYFDKTSHQLLIYNGTGFRPLGNSIITNQYSTTQLGNTIINQGDTIINDITQGNTDPTVLLQGGTPGTPQNGNFNVSGTGRLGSLSVAGTGSMGSLDVSGSGALGSLSVSGNTTLNTATVQNALVAGSLTTAAISAPTSSALAISTPGAAAVTGGISIKSGDSSTTASGDITIDTGAGIVDGQVIETKTFEAGTENMQAWYGDTIAQSNTFAHSGSESLKMTTTATNWGINENATNAPVTPGHQYYFSLWVRAGTTPRTITASIKWGSSTLTIGSTTDSASGWTQISGTGSAPATATYAYFYVTGGAAIGEVHYFDDLSVTDLSSASAAAKISIGGTNAKLVTIGNMNEIGATTINGSSGITLNSGSASLQANSGVINLNASAASSFTASQGSLTLSAAATSTWGLTQATSGVGGSLTINAGKGGPDTNNNGGNLVLQGGAANGTGTPGSVIIKPPANTTAAFQIQNASGTSLFSADTINMQLTVNGHLVTGNSSGSTGVAAGPAACTTPTLTITGNDTAGTVTITTGTGCAGTGNLATITFAHAYTTAPTVTLTPGNPAAASLQYYRDTSTSSFGISSGTQPVSSTVYVYDYQVLQ